MDDLRLNLGVSKACLARYFGVDEHTVARWCKTGAPVHVIRHIELLVGYQAALDAVKKA